MVDALKSLELLTRWGDVHSYLQMSFARYTFCLLQHSPVSRSTACFINTLIGNYKQFTSILDWNPYICFRFLVRKLQSYSLNRGFSKWLLARPTTGLCRPGKGLQANRYTDEEAIHEHFTLIFFLAWEQFMPSMKSNACNLPDRSLFFGPESSVRSIIRICLNPEDCWRCGFSGRFQLSSNRILPAAEVCEQKWNVYDPRKETTHWDRNQQNLLKTLT